MKKIITLLSLSISCLFFSQEKMNIIKTNVTAYAFRNINISYERAITKWFSVNVGYVMIPSGNVPFLKTFLKDETSKEFTDVQVGMTNFTFEPRFYLGGKYGKGFYITPYYRNSSFKADELKYHYDYIDSNEDVVEIPLLISGSATANSVGVMLGNQFVFGRTKNLVLDLWIIGGHYGKGKGDFAGKSSRPLTQQEQDQIKEDLSNIDIPLIKYEVQTDASGAKIKLDGPWAGLRSGISFGYRF